MCYNCDLRFIEILSKELDELYCSNNPNLNTPPKLLVNPKDFDYEGCGFTKIPNWEQTYLNKLQRTR